MEFRVKKRVGAFIAGILLSLPVLAQHSFEFEARRLHSRPPLMTKAATSGKLTIDDAGILFEESSTGRKPPKDPRNYHWDYRDIQQLKIAPTSLSLLTYEDIKWELGADREYQFELVSGKTFDDAYKVLKTRLDQRFVAAIAAAAGKVVWAMPVKHLGRLIGDEGTLRVEQDQIVYDSADRRHSRTWRYEDIENISSSGPFELTIVTFERAKRDYGNRKQFNFELKQRLEEDQYDRLWLRLNQSKGLKILSSYRGMPSGQ